MGYNQNHAGMRIHYVSKGSQISEDLEDAIDATSDPNTYYYTHTAVDQRPVRRERKRRKPDPVLKKEADLYCKDHPGATPKQLYAYMRQDHNHYGYKAIQIFNSLYKHNWTNAAILFAHRMAYYHKRERVKQLLLQEQFDEKVVQDGLNYDQPFWFQRMHKECSDNKIIRYMYDNDATLLPLLRHPNRFPTRIDFIKYLKNKGISESKAAVIARAYPIDWKHKAFLYAKNQYKKYNKPTREVYMEIINQMKEQLFTEDEISPVIRSLGWK